MLFTIVCAFSLVNGIAIPQVASNLDTPTVAVQNRETTLRQDNVLVRRGKRKWRSKARARSEAAIANGERSSRNVSRPPMPENLQRTDANDNTAKVPTNYISFQSIGYSPYYTMHHVNDAVEKEKKNRLIITSRA